MNITFWPVLGPAKIYLQDYELPLILTHVGDCSYAAAMELEADMQSFARSLALLMDRHANMDF